MKRPWVNWPQLPPPVRPDLTDQLARSRSELTRNGRRPPDAEVEAHARAVLDRPPPDPPPLPWWRQWLGQDG